MRYKDKKKTDNNIKKAYEYLTKEKGLSSHVAAAAIGNFQQESGYSLNTEAYNPNDLGKPSFGLAQWRGDRLDKLKEVTGDKMNTLEGQLDFMVWELQNTEKRAYQKLQEASNPKEAAVIFSKFYERPHKDYAHNDKRANNALNVFSTYASNEDEGYDFFNDPDELFTEENKKQYRPTREDMGLPKAQYDLIPFTTPSPSKKEEKKEEVKQAEENIAKAENEYNFTQELIKRSGVQLVDTQYKSRDLQKGGEAKKNSDNYGLMDFVEDAYQAWFNPKNWGVEEYTGKNFDEAYTKARQNGEKEFIYKNRRYSTNYDGTPEEQLRETGITDDQLQGTNWVRDRLHKNLNPIGYKDPVSRMYNSIIKNEKEENKNYIYGEKAIKNRKDAYNLYMGKPQENDTFSVSSYKPTNSKDKDVTYYSINDEELKNNLLYWLDENGKLTGERKDGTYGESNTIYTEDNEGFVMGNHIISQGEDENGTYLSYYDKWDISPMDFGKPIEIYDRVYYEENPDYQEYIKARKERDKLGYRYNKNKTEENKKEYEKAIQKLEGFKNTKKYSIK